MPTVYGHSSSHGDILSVRGKRSSLGGSAFPARDGDILSVGCKRVRWRTCCSSSRTETSSRLAANASGCPPVSLSPWNLRFTVGVARPEVYEPSGGNNFSVGVKWLLWTGGTLSVILVLVCCLPGNMEFRQSSCLFSVSRRRSDAVLSDLQRPRAILPR